MAFFYAEISYPDGWIVGTEFDDYLNGENDGRVMLGLEGNDHIRGNGGNDNLYGHQGNDTLDGGDGADIIDGGEGVDTASFFYTNHAVVVNLDFGTAKPAPGEGPTEYEIVSNLDTGETTVTPVVWLDQLYNIENVIGSIYNDHIQGSEALGNHIDGMGGADVIMGWGGADRLDGNFGNDTVVGGDGNDTVSGGFGNDHLQGNAGIDAVDYFYSYQGVSVNLAAGEAHVLPTYSFAYKGGMQFYVMNTYADTDSLSGFENVIGSQFDDVITGDDGANALSGGLGHDKLTGLGGGDTLDGADGNDTIDGGAGADLFQGGAGSDWIDYRSSGNVVGINLAFGYGTLGDALGDDYFGMENMFGTDHAAGDMLIGNHLGNWIEALGGNDVIYGVGGNDTVQAGYGNDAVNAGEGSDSVNGGDGADTLDGGAGYDTVNFNPSFGGIDPFGPGVSVNLVTGVVSGLGNDGERVSNFEAVIGTSFDDAIYGNDAWNMIRGGVNQDTIGGGNGNDTLYGGEGHDVVTGGAGNDLIVGGLGRDFMAGGLGNDTFLFSPQSTGKTAATRDIIGDFAKGADRIGLAAIDADTTLAGNQAFFFIDDDAFTGAAGQLRSSFVGANTVIEADTNGDAVADFQIQLTGQINLSALDFVL